jgi:hypothetical protein
MESSNPVKVLVVEHKTSATPQLLNTIRERARHGPCVFTLLVPRTTHGLHKVVDPHDQEFGEARSELDHTLPAIREAAGMPVEGMVGDPDPVAAVADAINLRGFDEIIISTPSPRLARWLRLDLPSKISGMGLPVTQVTPSHHEMHSAAA